MQPLASCLFLIRRKSAGFVRHLQSCFLKIITFFLKVLLSQFEVLLLIFVNLAAQGG